MWKREFLPQIWFLPFQKIMLKGCIVPLPKEFVEFLLEDRFVVSETCFPRFDGNEKYDEGEDPWPDEEPETQSKEFPVLEQNVNQIIQDLGGSVFPKLNTKAPQDATWMNSTCTLKCDSFSEILLLLKSSDLISHILLQNTNDIENKNNIEHCLQLRKWYNLNPAMEFRCFVRNHSLIAISQRDDSNYYPFLFSMIESLQQRILQFYIDHINHKFFNEFNFTFDVYLTQKKVYLIDFNPWGGDTNSLLFEWVELDNENVQLEGTQENTTLLDETTPVFRVILKQSGIKPSLAIKSRLPFDLVDVSNESAISEFVQSRHE